MSESSLSDSDELSFLLDDFSTPARTGLAREGRHSSLMDLVNVLRSLEISGTPCTPHNTPAKVSISENQPCQDPTESSVVKDTEGTNANEIDDPKSTLEQSLHTDLSRNSSRRSLGDKSVEAILKHVDQPGRDLEADVDELKKLSPLMKCRRKKRYFDFSSPCETLDESMDEANSSLLDHTATFISTYFCVLKKAKKTVGKDMSPQEKSAIVRQSLDREFEDTVTSHQKERILQTCMQCIEHDTEDPEEPEVNNNCVKMQDQAGSSSPQDPEEEPGTEQVLRIIVSNCCTERVAVLPEFIHNCCYQKMFQTNVGH